MATKILQIVGNLGDEIYTQNDEPIDAKDGALWVDLDDEGIATDIKAVLAEAKASGEFDGEDGKSAYEIAKENGYEGTEEEFGATLTEIANSSGLTDEQSAALEANTAARHEHSNKGLLDSLSASSLTGYIDYDHKTFAYMSDIPSSISESVVNNYFLNPETTTISTKQRLDGAGLKMLIDKIMENYATKDETGGVKIKPLTLYDDWNTGMIAVNAYSSQNEIVFYSCNALPENARIIDINFTYNDTVYNFMELVDKGLVNANARIYINQTPAADSTYSYYIVARINDGEGEIYNSVNTMNGNLSAFTIYYMEV